MNIVFFSMWYTPEPVGKPHSLAKELVLLGHSVTVVTTFPNYPEGKVYNQYKNCKFIYREELDGVKIIRVRAKIDRSTNAFKRMIAMSSFSINSVFVSLFLKGKTDIVWTYQIGLPGMLYSIIRRIPHLHEIQDLWPAWGEGSLRGISGSLAKFLVKYQRMIYNQAKHLTTISEGFSKAVSEIYKIPENKISILPNWADSQQFNCINHKDATRAQFDLPDGFLITYGGNIGTAQGLDALVSSSIVLKDIPDLYVVIVGDGVEKERLMSIASKAGNSNLIFRPKIPASEMGALLAVSDVLYLGLGKDKKYSITIPSKTYAYLSAAKPILAVADPEGDVAKLIKMNDLGFVAPPEDVDRIVKTIRKILDTDPVKMREMGDKAYKLIQTKFSGPYIARDYSNLLDEIQRN